MNSLLQFKPLIRYTKLLTTVCLSLCMTAALAATTDFPKENVEEFVERMQKHGFDEAEVRALLDQAEHKQAIIDAMTRPAEGVMPWHEYRKIFIKPERVEAGVVFWNEHADTLARAEKEFGVPAAYIVAIIGVETRFGRYTGKWRVVDALATLGFNYPKRGKFFTSELEHFMLMTREQNLDPLALKGSYAGAMGLGQFISSSYRNFAIDFDGDNKADLWNVKDAIGSVANYFAKHGWQAGKAVASQAGVNQTPPEDALSVHGKPEMPWSELKQAYGIRQHDIPIENEDLTALLAFNQIDHNQEPHKEYWVALNNFYVITRYNHSKLYALAVHQLASETKRRHDWLASK